MSALSTKFYAERQRVIAVVGICTVLVLAGVANSEIGKRKVVEAPVLNANVSSALVASGASSSAWYCAGPLPIGARKESSSIAIANISNQSVDGQLVIAVVGGSVKTEPISVAGHAQAVLALERTGPAGFASVTVIINEAGVGVSEIVHSSPGVSSASCVTHTGANAYLAAGGTKDPANVTLALYDPGSTPAVASLSFATSSGPVSPPIFQGLSVLAGQVILVNVGHYVFMKALVASIVHAAGGHIVVGAMETVAFNKGVASSLATATALPATRWYISAAPDGPSARQVFYVVNPSTTAAHVLAHLVSSSGSANVNVNIGADSVTMFGLAPDPVGTALRWASITSTNGVAVVVARATTVIARIPAAKRPAITSAASSAKTTKTPSKVSSAKAPVANTADRAALLPALTPGYAVTTGVTATSRIWLLAGGEVDPKVAEVITLTNPSERSIRATVRIVRPGSGGIAGLPVLASYTVAPNATISVALDVLVGLDYSVPIVVDASAPLLAGALLYAKGSSPAGLSASAAIPVA